MKAVIALVVLTLAFQVWTIYPGESVRSGELGNGVRVTYIEQTGTGCRVNVIALRTRTALTIPFGDTVQNREAGYLLRCQYDGALYVAIANTGVRLQRVRPSLRVRLYARNY